VPAWLVALRAEYAQAGRQPAEITLVAANSEAVAGTVAEHGVDLGFVEGPSAPRGLRSGAGPAVLSLLAVHENVAASLLAVVPVPGLELGRRLRAVWAGAAQPPSGPARDLVAVAIRLGAPPEPA